METSEIDDAALRTLAREVECFIPAEVRALAGQITQGTEDAWNKRGVGPPSIMFGKQRLYPIGPLKAWLHARMRDRASGVGNLL